MHSGLLCNPPFAPNPSMHAPPIPPPSHTPPHKRAPHADALVRSAAGGAWALPSRILCRRRAPLASSVPPCVFARLPAPSPSPRCRLRAPLGCLPASSIHLLCCPFLSFSLSAERSLSLVRAQTNRRTEWEQAARRRERGTGERMGDTSSTTFRESGRGDKRAEGVGTAPSPVGWLLKLLLTFPFVSGV